MQTSGPDNAECAIIRTISVTEAEQDIEGSLLALQQRFNPPTDSEPQQGLSTQANIYGNEPQVFSIHYTPNKPPNIEEPRTGPPPVTISWTLKGCRLKILIDSGSTVDILSARAVSLLRLGLRELDKVLNINLGTHGARSKTQHWCTTDFDWQHIQIPNYRFFVTPLRGYDGILGTPFLQRVGALVGVSPPRLVFENGVEYRVEGEHSGSRVHQQECLSTEPSESSVDLVPEEPVSEEMLKAEGYQQTQDYEVDVEAMVRAMISEYEVSASIGTDVEYIREATERILKEYKDVFPESLPHGLPPLREVNHRIQLIDPNKKVRPKVYSIPLKYEQQIRDQINAYCDSDWFFPTATDDAAPAFVVPKKDPTQGRLVVDLRERNANTVRDESPLPDMRAIRERVARHKYRSQFDFTKSYNQIRIEPDSVKHSAFKLPFGTFGSNVVHMGDLNAPATLHRLLFTMFRHHIGKFVDVFFDNVFVYSDDAREHVRHVRTVLDILRTHRFFLNPGDVELFSSEMVALGALINDQGILVEDKRIDKIRDWPVPKSKQDIMRFMGTVQWISDHYPYLAIVAAPLTELTGDIP
jgi:hypothetical protein